MRLNPSMKEEVWKEVLKLLEVGLEVAPCRACRPWIFFINKVLYFLKFNGSGME